MNKITLMGRLGKDPELKSTQSGQSAATFSLAIDESYKNREGTKVEKTLWVNIIAWGKTGELAAKFLKKGRQVLIAGKLQIRQYEAKDGSGKRYATEVVVDNFGGLEFIGDKPRDDDSGRSDSNEEPAQEPVEDGDIPF